MADISFKGFVEKYDGKGPWTVAEPHAVKGDDDKWVTKSRTFHKVWLPDGLGALNEGELVKVVGRQKTVAYDKQDGSKGYSLVVNATAVTDKDGGEIRQAIPEPYQPVGEPSPDGWESQEVPF